MPAAPDGVTDEPRVHLDRQYLAVTDQDPHPHREFDIRWFRANELRDVRDAFPDTRAQALTLLASLDVHCDTADAPDIARTLAEHMTEPPPEQRR